MLALNKKKKVKSKHMYQQEDCWFILVRSDNPPSLSVLVCPRGEEARGGRVGQSLTEARESGSV